MAREFTGGEAVVVQAKRRRLTDEQVADVRRKWMKRMKDAGSPVDEIGSIFRCTRRHVFRELATLEAERDGQRRPA